MVWASAQIEEKHQKVWNARYGADVPAVPRGQVVFVVPFWACARGGCGKSAKKKGGRKRGAVKYSMKCR
jgi:hypothetical protein